MSEDTQSVKDRPPMVPPLQQWPVQQAHTLRHYATSHAAPYPERSNQHVHQFHRVVGLLHAPALPEDQGLGSSTPAVHQFHRVVALLHAPARPVDQGLGSSTPDGARWRVRRGAGSRQRSATATSAQPKSTTGRPQRAPLAPQQTRVSTPLGKQQQVYLARWRARKWPDAAPSLVYPLGLPSAVR